mmetsp:Transcript_1237/g.1980  ORF Transcript_1237/g.1980 Transcript_1237/m.1980 type:complete len:85 (-) Transcript_1237:1084-1338(-)
MQNNQLARKKEFRIRTVREVLEEVAEKEKEAKTKKVKTHQDDDPAEQNEVKPQPEHDMCSEHDALAAETSTNDDDDGYDFVFQI